MDVDLHDVEALLSGEVRKNGNSIVLRIIVYLAFLSGIANAAFMGLGPGFGVEDSAQTSRIGLAVTANDKAIVVMQYDLARVREDVTELRNALRAFDAAHPPKELLERVQDLHERVKYLERRNGGSR